MQFFTKFTRYTLPLLAAALVWTGSAAADSAALPYPMPWPPVEPCTFTKATEHECIDIDLPNNSLWCSSHFMVDEGDHYVATKSAEDGLLYLLMVIEDPNLAEKISGGEEASVEGGREWHYRDLLDSSAKEELYYGWAGGVFADLAAMDERPYEMMRYIRQTEEHTIVIVVAGPADQDVTLKATDYYQGLQVSSFFAP